MKPVAYLAPLALVGLLTACSSPDSEDMAATSQPSASSSSAAAASSSAPANVADGTCYDISQVDRTSATDVAQAYAATAYCWDSTTDQRTTDGVLRAKDIMSTDYYKMQAGSQTRNSLQAQFNEAYKHKAYTSVRVSPTTTSMSQDIGNDKAVRAVTSEWSWVGRDDHRMNGGHAQDNVYLEKHGGKWVVVASDTTVFENE